MAHNPDTLPGTPPKISLKMPAQFKKPCYYFWICDCSESMGLKNKSNNLVKMDEINKAIPLAIEKISDYSKTNKKGQITMRTLKFSDRAEWVDKDSIPVAQYVWKDLSADGVTALGDAFRKMAQALKTIDDGGTMPKTAYPPVLVLITDGYPTDEWNTGLNELMEQFWAQEAVRIAIGLEGADEEILKAFIGDVDDAEKKLVKINDANLSTLADSIKLVTTVYGIPSDKKKPLGDPVPPAALETDEDQKRDARPVENAPVEEPVRSSDATIIPVPPPDTTGNTDTTEPGPQASSVQDEIIF
ncbi:MAG: VWA domain-containing protein [Methanoregula sp.]|jgi:uncharacterized protein YegL